MISKNLYSNFQVIIGNKIIKVFNVDPTGTYPERHSTKRFVGEQ